MQTKIALTLSSFVLALAVVAPVAASTPQYGANASNVALDPITENWTCASPSNVPAGRCYTGDVQGQGTAQGDSSKIAAINAVFSHVAIAPSGYLFWAGTAGNLSLNDGPGSTYDHGGDHFVIWRTPNTHDGRRFNSEVILMEDETRPDDGGFWVVGGFLWYPGFSSFVMPAVTVYPTGNQNTLTDIVFYVGESVSGYQSWSWTPIVHFTMNPNDRTASDDYGVRWHFQGTHFVEDSEDPSRLIGMVPWTNLDGSGPLRGSSPALIDFSTVGDPGIGAQLCLGFEPLDPDQGGSSTDPHVRSGFTSAYDFYCYWEEDVTNFSVDPGQPGSGDSVVQSANPVMKRPVAAGGGEALPYRDMNDFVRNVSLVTTSLGTQGEIWRVAANQDQWCKDPNNVALGNYTDEDDCALARNACGTYLTDTNLYLDNRDNLLNGKSERLHYAEWSTTTLLRSGAWNVLDNDLQGLFGSTEAFPSPTGDHGNHYWAPLRVDWGETLSDGTHKEGLYVNVKRSICQEPWWWGNARWSGNGKFFLNLLEQ